MPRPERLTSPDAETPSPQIALAKKIGSILEFYMFPFNFFVLGVFLWTGKVPERDE